ncbi:MAG: Ldh family oxidoreductase [Nanoarchaeota archaeon]
MKIKITKLKEKMLSVFQEKFTAKEAEIITEYLIWAEMSGIKTQGMIKLIGAEPLQDIEPKHAIKIERDTKLSQLINAGGAPAPLVSSIATDTVITKSKQYGFGIVGVHNTFSSNGSQAYYVEKIAKMGLIGFMCSRSPAATSAFGSIDPLFGTNPFGVAFPTQEEPLVFDMATSAITWYGLILAKARGEKIPKNVAIDVNGAITTDPAKAMEGSLLSFDKSYKGSTIGALVEVLAGPLVSSAYIDNKTFKEEWGSLFIALNPNLLVDAEKFKSSCSDLIKKIKNSRKKKGVTEIRLPGERSKTEYKKTLTSGFVDIDEVILKKLKFI